jgi:hypothetical protein
MAGHQPSHPEQQPGAEGIAAFEHVNSHTGLLLGGRVVQRGRARTVLPRRLAHRRADHQLAQPIVAPARVSRQGEVGVAHLHRVRGDLPQKRAQRVRQLGILKGAGALIGRSVPGAVQDAPWQLSAYRRHIENSIRAGNTALP